MKFIKHATAQPFILATGVAALVHSTWALAVLFSGEPPAWDPSSPASWARWAYWLLPALLIAFALDVGQVATSAEIRAGERTPTKYVTFIVFALATYYLQWIYIAHHMPALQLGAGVYQEGLAARVVLLTRNAAIWFIPALLPLSTTMYTLSGGSRSIVTEQKPSIIVSPQDAPQLQDENDANAYEDTYSPQWLNDIIASELDDPDDVLHSADCEHCGWSKQYDNPDSAKRGLAAHKQYCVVLNPPNLPVLNGHKGE